MDAYDVPRDRSGFAREMSTYDVFVFNVLGYSMGVAIATNATFIGGFAPRAELWVVVTFGLLVALFNGYTYGCFSACLPHNGGDYVFVESTFGRGLGFVANFGFTISQIYGLALVSGWTVSAAIVPALTTYGLVAHRPALVALGEHLSTQEATIVGGTLLLLLIMAITAMGTRPVRLLLNVIFAIAFASTIALAVVMINAEHGDFVVRFNAFMASHGGGSDAYEAILRSWEARGGVLNAPASIWESMRAVPLGFLLFLGFTYSVYVGSEVRKPAKSQSRGIMLALFAGYCVFALVLWRYSVVVGRDFNAAIGNPDVLREHPLPAGTSMIFFAGLLTSSEPINLLLNIGSVLWFAILPFVIVQVCVRNVHAWSLDSILPERLATLTARRQAPVFAATAVVVVGWILLMVTNVFGITLVGAVALSAVCFFITACAAVAYPSRRPTDFALAPRLARRDVLGVPIMAVCGALSAICFAFILYVAVWYPQVSMGTRGGTLIMIAIVYGAGSLWYIGRMRWLHQRRARAFSKGEVPRLNWTVQSLTAAGEGTATAAADPEGGAPPAHA